MYTKSMTSALAEARAYTEANMKRILQALQDKLSKEGGAAGFDDLRKVAKSMGLNLTKDMMKSMPGIKQHRDGDYILEELDEATPVPPRDLMLTYGKPGEKVKAYYTKFMQDLQNKASELRKKGFVVDKMGRTQPMSQLRDRIPEELDIDNMSEEQLDEALDVKWDSNKQGWFDRQGRRRYLGVMATNKLMAKALDKAKKTGDFINPYKLKHGQKPEEKELEEALSIPNARKEIQKIYDKAKRDGFLGTTGHDDFKELLKQTDRKKLYRDMHKVGSFFASASGAKPKAVGKELVDLSYKVNEETELEEAFSKKDFQKLEQSNDHTEAAERLINMFGTSDEKKEMKDIKARHQKTGYINGKDYSKRQMMVNKYYSRLK